MGTEQPGRQSSQVGQARSAWSQWLRPQFIRQLPHDQLLRGHVFQITTLIALVVPTLREVALRLTLGHWRHETSTVAAIVVLQLSNYALVHWHRRLHAAATAAVWMTSVLMAVSFHQVGLGDPQCFTGPLNILVAGLTAGRGMALVQGAFWSSFYAWQWAFVPTSTPSAELAATASVLLVLCAVVTIAVYAYETERTHFSKLRNQLFDIVDSSPDPVALISNGLSTYHNRAMVRLTGQDPHHNPVPPDVFLPEWARDKLLDEAIPQAIQAGSWTGETALLRPNGEEVAILQTLLVQEQQQGSPLQGAWFMKDLTELKQQRHELRVAKEAAEAALKARSQFLANMSHEIRTPMNGVLGMAQLLSSEVHTARGKEQIATLLRSGEHLLHIINDILDLSKLESGRLALDARTFCPAQTVENATRLFTTEAAAKNIALITKGLANRQRILADEARFRQVVYNLLANAIKFTEEGQVTVTLTIQKETPSNGPGSNALEKRCRVELRVSDTGVGIAREQLDTIFQPFEQADSSASRRFGGTGLGLSICSRLAQLFGGELSVESEPGAGSTFTLAFHAATAVVERTYSAATSLEPAPSPLSMPSRVLVAEDNAINRKVVDGLLRRLGIEASFVKNGQEAVDAVAREPFDVVLMDCHMPVLDGFQATQQILANEGPKPRIIAMTASALSEERERCFQCGMSDFLAKPLRQKDLARVLAASTSDVRLVS